MNTNIQNRTSASEANQPQMTTNEEILSLLRKLVESEFIKKAVGGWQEGSERGYQLVS